MIGFIERLHIAYRLALRASQTEVIDPAAALRAWPRVAQAAHQANHPVLAMITSATRVDTPGRVTSSCRVRRKGSIDSSILAVKSPTIAVLASICFKHIRVRNVWCSPNLPVSARPSSGIFDFDLPLARLRCSAGAALRTSKVRSAYADFW